MAELAEPKALLLHAWLLKIDVRTMLPDRKDLAMSSLLTLMADAVP